MHRAADPKHCALISCVYHSTSLHNESRSEHSNVPIDKPLELERSLSVTYTVIEHILPFQEAGVHGRAPPSNTSFKTDFEEQMTSYIQKYSRKGTRCGGKGVPLSLGT